MSDLLQLGSRSDRPHAPRPEELRLQFSLEAIEELDNLLTHYPDKKSCILPGLWIAQREYGGFLSGAAIAEVAFRLERSYAEVEGVATFYSMYNTAHAVGKHMIEVCTCLTCQVCDAYPVAEYLKKKLGVDFGETTADGMFTLHEVECLNACDRAPLIQVGDEYHGPVDEAYLDNLLENLRNRERSTVVQLADEIVQSQLANFEKAGGEAPVRHANDLAPAPHHGFGSYPGMTGFVPTDAKSKPTAKPIKTVSKPKTSPPPTADSPQAEVAPPPTESKPNEETPSSPPTEALQQEPKAEGKPPRRIVIDESS